MRFRSQLRVGFLVLLMGLQTLAGVSLAHADAPPTFKLMISQFKLTTSDGQFFTLYNPSTTDTLDLSTFELQYFNNNDLTKATSSKMIALSGFLAPQSYYMISDGASVICYQLTVNTASLSFSTTSGFAEVLQMPLQANPGTPVTPVITDYVGWAKSTSKGNDTLSVSNPATSVTVPSGTNINWYRNIPAGKPAANTWQPTRPDPANACNLQIVQAGGTAAATPINPGNQLITGPQPPATIVSLASTASSSDAPSLPPADVGLMSPQITELLPNPTGTGNDASDEFIELYNPNDAPFDLSAFTLQTGSTTKHSYVFPDDTALPAKAFVAFYSSDTGLSLSNTSGMADLLDPFGNTLSQTEAYGTAKDGQSWALANGKWYFTSQPTPNAANVVKQVVSIKKASSTTAKKASTSHSSSAASSGASTGTSSSAAATPAAPIHPLMLAAVGILAVGYGIYEYRHDIANKIAQLRGNRKPGRQTRVTAAGR